MRVEIKVFQKEVYEAAGKVCGRMEEMMETSYYTDEELKELGFAHVGHDVQISCKTSIYGAKNIWIGNHVRIDDFCVLSGKITFGNYIHVAVMTGLFGGTAGITFEDYSGISSRCAVYAATDDYSGDYMTNPTVPEKFTHVIEEEVVIGKYVDIGTGSTVLPGVKIGEGCAFGAMTLVGKSTPPWGFYMGYQCIRIKERSQGLLQLDISELEES